MTGKLANFWNLSRDEQDELRRRCFPPEKSTTQSSFWSEDDEWYDDDEWYEDDPVDGRTVDGTTVTVYADGRVKFSNPGGLPSELVDELLGRGTKDSDSNGIRH